MESDFSLVTCWHENENHFEGFLNYLHDESYSGELVIVINDLNLSPRLDNICNSIQVKFVRYVGRNFSELWNMGIEAASNDWVLIHAADERFNFKEISTFDFRTPDIHVFKRYNLFDGVHYPNCFPIENQERLFRKEIRYHGVVHERLPEEHHRRETHSVITHFAYDDWTEAKHKLQLYSDLEIQRKGPMRNFLRFCFRLVRGILSFQNFLDGAFGFRWWLHVIKFYVVCIIKLIFVGKKNA